MKIIITGATGAFGAAMTRYFANKGHFIYALGRTKKPHPNLLKIAEYIQADITQPFKLPNADVIIHGAALSDDKAKFKTLYNPNVIGTINTINASSHIKKFIFISSSSVYLPQKTLIKESIAGHQNNKLLSDYGKSKLIAEQKINEYFKQESCFVLRPRAFYGEGDTQILPRMMKLVKNKTFNKPGDLNIQLSMTHYQNIAKAIECCIESNLKGINTYNVADDETYIMYNTLKEIFKAIYGKYLPEKDVNIRFLKVLAFFRIKGFTPLLIRALTENMVLDTSSIKKELNYKSQITFKKSLPLIEEWVKKNGGYKTLESPNNQLCWQV